MAGWSWIWLCWFKLRKLLWFDMPPHKDIVSCRCINPFVGYHCCARNRHTRVQHILNALSFITQFTWWHHAQSQMWIPDGWRHSTQTTGITEFQKRKHLLDSYVVKNMLSYVTSLPFHGWVAQNNRKADFVMSGTKTCPPLLWQQLISPTG